MRSSEDITNGKIVAIPVMTTSHLLWAWIRQSPRLTLTSLDKPQATIFDATMRTLLAYSLQRVYKSDFATLDVKTSVRVPLILQSFGSPINSRPSQLLSDHKSKDFLA